MRRNRPHPFLPHLPLDNSSGFDVEDFYPNSASFYQSLTSDMLTLPLERLSLLYPELTFSVIHGKKPKGHSYCEGRNQRWIVADWRH